MKKINLLLWVIVLMIGCSQNDDYSGGYLATGGEGSGFRSESVMVLDRECEIESITYPFLKESLWVSCPFGDILLDSTDPDEVLVTSLSEAHFFDREIIDNHLVPIVENEEMRGRKYGDWIYTQYELSTVKDFYVATKFVNGYEITVYGVGAKGNDEFVEILFNHIDLFSAY